MSAAPKLHLTESPEHPLIAGRYRIGQLLSSRCGVARFLATDTSITPSGQVQLIRELLQPESEPPIPADGSIWPSLAWEERLRTRCRHLGLPRLLGRFADEQYAYLALEVPHGATLWDAWDDPIHDTATKFDWLIQLADLMQVLHVGGAILETLRPDTVVLSSSGQIVLCDPGHLLPLPLPADAAIIGDFATAPELMTGAWIDARSDLFCFGALVYALLLGRELTDLDFSSPGVPTPFLERFPDAHPLLGRLLTKSFNGAIDRRFPTSEGFSADPSGFSELIETLEQCQRTLSRVRLEVASWSSTGMIRSSNEDAYAVLKTSVGRQEEIEDYALVVVADGMGGSAAGEVAAALAVQTIMCQLSAEPPFAEVGGGPNSLPPSVDAEPLKGRIVAALKEANRAVYLASRQGVGRRGMGCTAEAVFTDGRRVVVGHVGDSRVYRMRDGELTLLTRDQTYIYRLIESGEITAEEAESHPRRSELQQAIGGWSDVTPEVLDVTIEPNDWILVCSDGLSNQVKLPDMRTVFERAPSAESAARQLVNLANLAGAPDNATAVVIRAV